MRTNNIIPLNIPSNQIVQHRLDDLRKQCQRNFRIAPQYHDMLAEYVLTYWSVEYLIKRLERNALLMDRNDRQYNVIFDNTNINKLLVIAQADPMQQVRLSFRRANAQYNIDNYVLIQSVYQPIRA